MSTDNNNFSFSKKKKRKFRIKELLIFKHFISKLLVPILKNVQEIEKKETNNEAEHNVSFPLAVEKFVKRQYLAYTRQW